MFWFILAILLVLVGGCITIYQGMENGAGAAVASGVISLVICGVLFGLSFIGSVPTGYTGILTTFGKVENITLDAGLNMKAPWQKIVTMDNRVQKQTVELNCFSSDIQEVSMKYTVNYQINSADAMTIYKTIGVKYYDNVIVPNITEAVKTSVAKYTAEALVNNRSDLAVKIEEDLTSRLNAYNIILVSTAVEDMDFTDAFTDAVEAKQVAQQNKLKAETEAEQKVIEAEAAAKVKGVEADAEAYQIKVKADAEAAANKEIAASLTDSLINYMYYQTWNGELPEVSGADSVIIKQPE
jgi:regulator of protease activity HflC (stomatin/prohibitin superfamily)